MESPFREHFNTNYVPEDAEIRRIRAHLAPHEAELARLESLIHDLTIQINDLAAQRDRVKDYIDPHRAIISHPRRLPQDILEQIFLACLPAQHNAIMSASEAPLLLGRICSAWRTVAFTMPRLWTTLHIPLAFFAEREERKAAMVEWLQRSEPLPVVLSVMHDDHGDSENGEAAHSVWESILQLSARWHTLDISPIGSTDFFERLAPVEAPQLADILLGFPHRFYHGEGLHILSSTIFRVSPRVTITAPMLGGLVPFAPFTWDHLTHLTLYCRGLDYWERGLSSYAAYRLLKGCPHLKVLKLHPTSNDQDVWVHEPLLLPFLESLIIVNGSYTLEDLVNFIQCLTMPRLVVFHAGNSAIPMSSIGFLKCLAEYSPVISDLRLFLLDFTATSLVETLQRFRCLTTLNLTYQPTTLDGDLDPTDPLTFFTPSPSAPNPLPALKELYTHGRRVENTTLMNFLQKQLEYGTSLRDLHLTLYGDPPHVIPDSDIQSFATRGFRVGGVLSSSSHPPRGILPVGRNRINKSIFTTE